jgi:hypothetical protein
MTMQVFHGSYTAINVIDLGQSQANKDFGRGFYVTKYRQHAENWAKIIGRKHHTEGFVTEFIFNERIYVDKRFKVLRFDDYNEHWLDFVVLNRDDTTTEQQHDFDVVEGPIADDKITRNIDDYLAGLISKTDFLTMLKYHEETHQICFCTVKSLQFLKHTDKKQVSIFAHIAEPLVEQLMLDRQMDEMKAVDIFYSSATFGQLANPDARLYEKPWQEIYQMLKQELKLISK